MVCGMQAHLCHDKYRNERYILHVIYIHIHIYIYAYIYGARGMACGMQAHVSYDKHING